MKQRAALSGAVAARGAVAGAIGGGSAAGSLSLPTPLLARREDVPTLVSQLENDAGYLTQEADPTVPPWAKEPVKPSYTAAEVGADEAGAAKAALAEAKAYAEQQAAAVPVPDVAAQVGAHNVSATAHGDIRLLAADLADRLNALADSDDETLDQLSEIVDYIKANRGLIDAVTTAKVSVSDIVDDLETNVARRPLSAAQGVALKGLADEAAAQAADAQAGADAALAAADSAREAIPTAVSQLDNDAGYLTQHQDLSAYATTAAMSAALDEKANDYTVKLYNGTPGNPKGVRFATVNYSTCTSEAGVSMRVGMVSGHGNGKSYVFLQDAIIKVSYDGIVSVDNFKYYGAETPAYDGDVRQYGDIFWVVDAATKVVDFYCLMGQYSRVYQTPWRRLTYSTGGTVTQHTSCTVYSSGARVWANNSDFALKSDVAAVTLDSLGGDDRYYTEAEADELLAAKLSLSGGTMTGEIAIGQGDGKGIQLGTDGRINATAGTSKTATLLGVVSGNTVVGHTALQTQLRGSLARPTYNGASVALLSDVPAAETWTFALSDGTTVTKEVRAS